MKNKKLMLFASTLLLSGCLMSSKPAPMPAEFANADYQLSEQDAQKWVMASKQVEQCIYPNLTRIQQQHFSQEDSYIHSQYAIFYPLEDIIGEDYVKIIQADEKSMGYATYLFKKYKKEQVEPLPATQCQVLREKARDDLAVVKGQYKSGMVEVQKNEDGTPKNPDGIATNQNKFFFDIIKWGAAFLL